jgi:hypothetical protein
MKYQITSRTNSCRRHWEDCQATSLTGAKIACSLRFGSGFIEEVLLVAEYDKATRQRHVVAEKRNNAFSTWQNINQ